MQSTLNESLNQKKGDRRTKPVRQAIPTSAAKKEYGECRTKPRKNPLRQDEKKVQGEGASSAETRKSPPSRIKHNTYYGGRMAGAMKEPKRDARGVKGTRKGGGGD